MIFPFSFWKPPSNPFVNTKSTQFTNAAQNLVNFGNNFDETGSAAFSISAWLKANDLTHNGDIFGNYTGASGKGYEFQLETNGSIDWSLNNGVNFMEVHTAASTVATGTWIHIVIVSAGPASTQQTIYFNAVSKTLTTVSNTFSGSMTNSNIAYSGWRASIGADIQVNQISYWHGVALSSANVTALYAGGTPPNVMTLGIGTPRGYWYMGSGDAATGAGGFIDHSGNGFNGTGTNTPVFVSDVP